MDGHDEAKPGRRHHLREGSRINKRASKFSALFVLVILSLPSLASVSPGHQQGASADTKEPRIAPLEPGGDGRAAGSTNIRLRWSREGRKGLQDLQTPGSAGAGRGWKGCGIYKHTAPLEPGGEEGGAGSTNSRLRWSREGMEGLRDLQTYGSAGAGRGGRGCRIYKLPAPLEPGGDGRAAGSTNIRLRWSREGMEGLRDLQTFGSAGAGRGWKGCGIYKHSAPLEPGGDGRVAGSTNIWLRWSR